MRAPSLHLKLLGNRDSVNCCAVSSQQPHILASGSEDGRICLFDLYTGQLSQTLLQPNHTTFLSSAPTPGACHSSNDATTSNSSPQTQPDRVPVAALAFWSFPSSSSSSSSSSSAPAHSSPGVLYAACGRDILCLDPRAGPDPVSCYSHSRDDVAALSLSARGSHLAAGDDSGEVLIMDLVAGRPFKHMRSVHPSGMVTSVAFSGRKQWEVVTGGTDSSVARYDYSRARCLDRWPMGQLSQPILNPVVASRTSDTVTHTTDSTTVGGPGSAVAAESSSVANGADDGSTGQLFNPPFVHQLALADPDVFSCTQAGSSGGGAPGPRVQRQLAAVARGDGAIALFDINTQSSRILSGGSPVVDAAPTKVLKKLKQLPVPAVPAVKGARTGGHSSAKASRNTNPSTPSKKDQAAPAVAQDTECPEAAAGGVQTSEGGSPTASAESLPQLPQLPRLPYHHTLLGRGWGGHRRAACCVCFSSIKGGGVGAAGCVCGSAACGNNLPVLYSAGEDRRVICWDVAGATAGLGLGDEDREAAGRVVSPNVMLWEHLHPRKINDLCVVPWQQLQGDQGCSNGELLVVADTGKRINVYLVTQTT